MCFSQVTSSGGQELAICELENPGKIKGDCTIIAKAELDWTAERGLDEMCEDTWRWQSNNPNGYED